MIANKDWSHFILQYGIGVFALLFIYATSLYPGGSTANLDAVGFSWQHNYICNLMNHLAMNGEPNPSRPYAIAAILLLATTIGYFFFHTARSIDHHRYWTPAVKYGGMLSMAFVTLMFTRFHDQATLLSSLFGVLAVVGVLRALIVKRWVGFLASGGLLVLLLAVNNYIYYTEQGVSYLPVIQKITLAAVLTWILVLHHHRL